MKLIEATHLGMCFGVRDAITLAHKVAATEPLTMLGELVHNPVVNDELARQGIRVAHKESDITTSRVMITAHGTSNQTRSALELKGYKVAEATCPLVHFAHRSVLKLVAGGYYPVIIGKKDHVEVRGLTGDLGDHSVILEESEVVSLPSYQKYGVASQTTQPISRVIRMVQLIKETFPNAEVKFVDTVCQPTKQRQTAAEELGRACSIVIVVGGRNSNNTRELVATCQKSCPRVIQIESSLEIKPEWFQQRDTIGLTAGTSTPDTVITSVRQTLQALCIQRAA